MLDCQCFTVIVQLLFSYMVVITNNVSVMYYRHLHYIFFVLAVAFHEGLKTLKY